MQIRWRLRLAAAHTWEVWTGAQPRRLLAERAGGCSCRRSIGVPRRSTRQPAQQVKLDTLLALCTALECTPAPLTRTSDFAGLLALLHAASSAQIRGLTIGDADHAQRTLSLACRPFPAPLDPVSWAALGDCLRHREALRTLNLHVIVTMATRTGDSPAHQSYLTRVLRRAGTTPALAADPDLPARHRPGSQARCRRLGMQDSGPRRYLAGNVDSDRLERTPGIGRQPTLALQAPPCTP